MEVSQRYLDLRDDVRRQLAQVARATMAAHMKTGRMRLSVFEQRVKDYCDDDAVDLVLENAEAYAAWCERGWFLAGDALWATPGIALIVQLTWPMLSSDLDRFVAFLGAVAGRFVEFHADHSFQLSTRAAALMSHLERCSAEMPADQVEEMAIRGWALDAAAQKYAARTGEVA